MLLFNRSKRTESVNAKQDTGSKQKQTKRKLYNWHIWLGFNFAFLTMLLLATGTIATVSNEIDWLFKSQMRVVPGEKQVSWGDMEASVKGYIDPTHTLTGLAQSEGNWFAYKATVAKTNRIPYYVYVNQWTGEVMGQSSGLTVQRFFRDLHRYFFTPSIIGLPLVTMLAGVLSVSLYSGLKTTGRLRKAAFRLRFNKDPRIFLSDLHKVSGIWSMWFIALIVVTAFWYFIEFGFAIGKVRFEPPRPGLSAERIQELNDIMPILSADDIIARASEAFPNWRPASISYPLVPRQAITVLGYTGDFLVRSRANRVFLDPVSGAIIKVQKSKDINTVAYINEMADPLHFGNFGNLPTKLIWFVFGVLLTGLSVTGVMMTYKRLRKVHISRAQLKTFPILLLPIIAGFFYVNRYMGVELKGEVVSEYAHSYGEFNIVTTLEHVTESGNYLVRVVVSHANALPIIGSVDVTDNNDNTEDTDKPLSLRQMTFSNNTVFIGTLPDKSLWLDEAMRLSITFNSGNKAEFDLKS